MLKNIVKIICGIFDFIIIISLSLLIYIEPFKILLVFIISSVIYFIVNESVSILKKNRLNRLYTFKYDKRKNEYELQYNPAFGFHWINKQSFLKLRKDAISQLKQRFTNPTIIGITMTLNKININNNLNIIHTYSRLIRVIAIIPNSILTITNLRNLFTFSLSYKLIRIIFLNKLHKFKY